MKRLFLFTAMLVSASYLFSQNLVDALRYSQSYAGGTARSAALGGAFGSLGGDFTSASINPAGLGMYRSSEFTFTPEIYTHETTARYYGEETVDSKTNFNIANLGYVGTISTGESGLVSLSLGLGFNKINNFHQSILINGDNPHNEGTFADYVATIATDNNRAPDELATNNEFDDVFITGLFYDSYVLDHDEYGYYIGDPDFSLTTEQRKSIERSGKINEWVISGGLNINNFLYFGATFSILPVKYSEQSYFDEFNINNSADKYYAYHESLEVTGTGYSGKFGVILRPIGMLRIGGAIHTPITYKLTENFTTSMTSKYSTGTVFPINASGSRASDYKYSYKIVSPYKYITSASLVLGKLAVLSADIEFIDYTSMKIKDGEDGYNFANEIEEIKAVYSFAVNVKTGAEIRLGDYRVRGGFAYYDSPYYEGFFRKEENADAFHLSYSGGIGYRNKDFFFDLAYIFTTQDERYNLYSFNNDHNMSNLSSNKHRIMATIGFRF